MAHKKETNADGADRAGADDKLSASSAMGCVSSAWFTLFFACFFCRFCLVLSALSFSRRRGRTKKKREEKIREV